MEETALAFTDYASYCLTYILLLQNSLTFPWLLLLFQISLTNFEIPWLFPDLEKNSFFPDFSLTVGTLIFIYSFGIMCDWGIPLTAHMRKK